MAQSNIKHLKLPQRRQAVRINVPRLDIQVWSHREILSQAEAAKLLNLSASGALIQTRASYTPGAMIHCSFYLSGAGHFSLPAHVIRCMVKENMTDRFLLAVHFKIDQRTEEKMVRWIFRWMAHQHRLAR